MASKKQRAEAQLSILFPSQVKSPANSQNDQQGGTTKMALVQSKGRTDSNVLNCGEIAFPEAGHHGLIELCTAAAAPAPVAKSTPTSGTSVAQAQLSENSKRAPGTHSDPNEGAALPALLEAESKMVRQPKNEVSVIGAQDTFTYVEPLPKELTHTATVLLTGGAGFIGSHTAAHLLMRGNKVVVVDEVNDYYDVSQKEDNIAHLQSLVGKDSDRLVFVRGDINDIPLMTRIFEEHKPSFIVHLAARAGVRPSLKDPYLYIRANILGTTALLEISRKFPFVKHFVYASSSSVYGGSTKETFSEKDIVDRPVSPYAATKKACELMAATFNHLYGIQVSGLRFFTVYGPRGRPDMAPYKFLKRAAKGIAIDQYGDGSSERDYTFVDDIVSGVVRTMDRPAGCQVYNLGNGRPITLKRFIGLVSEVAAPVNGLKINYMPDQPGDVKRTCADISKARIMLNYNPETPFEEGLRKTFSWFMSRGSKGEATQTKASKTEVSQPGLRIVYDDMDDNDPSDASTNSGASSSEEDETMRSLSSSGSFDFAFIKRSTSAPAGVPQRIRNLSTTPKRRQFTYE